MGCPGCGLRRLADRLRRRREGVVVVLDEVPGDLPPAGEPHLVVAGDIAQRVLEGLDAVRPTDEVGVQRDAHHRARLPAFGVQAIELPSQDVGIAAGRHEVDVVGDDVVHLERVGNTYEPSPGHLDRPGLVVVEEVADVGESHLGHQIERTLGVGEGRCEPAVELLAGAAADRVDRVADERALLVLAHAEDVAGVVGAVRVELPAPRGARFDDFGMVIAHRDVERDAAAHAAAVHRLEHPPEAGAVAVVPVRVPEHVGHRAGPRGARRVARRLELVELDVRRDPERHPRAARPFDLRPPRVRQILVQAGVALHAGPGSYRRMNSSTSATGTTSAYLRAMSYTLAKCGLSCLSATHSSGTMVRKLRDRLSTTVARTQPEVEPPVTTTVSMRWNVNSDPRLVSWKAEAIRLFTTISRLRSISSRSSNSARREPTLMFCSESGVFERVPQTPQSSPDSMYATWVQTTGQRFSRNSRASWFT